MGVRSREGGDWPCGCGDQRVTAAVETRCGTGKGAHEGASRTWGGWGVGHQQCGPGRKTARRPASRLTRACDSLGWGYSPILVVGKRRHRGDVTCLSRQGQRRHRASPRRRLATAPSSAQLCREHVWRHEGPSWSARSPTARRERAPRTSTPHQDSHLSEDGWRAGGGSDQTLAGAVTAGSVVWRTPASHRERQVAGDGAKGRESGVRRLMLLDVR